MRPARAFLHGLSLGAALLAGCQVRGMGLEGVLPADGGSGSGGAAGGSAGDGGRAGSGAGGGGAGGAASAPDAATGGSETGAAFEALPPVDRAPEMERPPDAAILLPRDTAPLPPDAPPDQAAPPDLPPDRPPPAALLLVGGDALAPGEQAVQARLVMLGFRVTVLAVQSDEEVPAARRAATSHQLVFMSSSLPGGIGLPNSLREVAVPIVCARSTSYDNLGFNDDNAGGVSMGSQINVTSTAHPLAAGLAGNVVVVSPPNQLGWSQQPVPGATRIASIPGEPGQAAIVAFDRGAATRFGPAPARRVGLFPLEPAIPRLTPSGWALFDAAVRWAVGQL